MSRVPYLWSIASFWCCKVFFFIGEGLKHCAYWLLNTLQLMHHGWLFFVCYTGMGFTMFNFSRRSHITMIVGAFHYQMIMVSEGNQVLPIKSPQRKDVHRCQKNLIIRTATWRMLLWFASEKSQNHIELSLLYRYSLFFTITIILINIIIMVIIFLINLSNQVL